MERQSRLSTINSLYSGAEYARLVLEISAHDNKIDQGNSNTCRLITDALDQHQLTVCTRYLV